MSGLISPKEMNFVPKRWGWELWICNGEKYCGKKLFIKQGHHLSFHHHELKDEVLFVESGHIRMVYSKHVQHKPSVPEASIWIEESFYGEHMGPGYAFHVEPGVRHQMQAIEDTMIFEFSTQHFDSDSYRTTMDLVKPTVQMMGAS